MITGFITYGLLGLLLFSFAKEIAESFRLLLNIGSSQKVSVIVIKAEHQDLSQQAYKFKVYRSDRHEGNPLYLTGYSSPWVFKPGEILCCYYFEKGSKLVAISLRGKKTSVIIQFLLILSMLMGVGLLMKSEGILSSTVFTDAFVSRAITLCLFMIAVVMIVKKSSVLSTLMRNSVRAQGYIVGIGELKDIDNEINEVPIVQFTWEGQTYRFKSNVVGYRNSSTGDRVPVIFHKDYPSFAEIDSFMFKWFEIVFWVLVILLAWIPEYLRHKN